jgi:predicted amidophosphoribosyltransferase
MTLMKSLINGLMRYYPRYCLLCRKKTDAIYLVCDPCFKALSQVTQACSVCGAPLFAQASLCGPCIKKVPYFDRTIAPFYYEPPIDRMIAQLKFHDDLSALYFFAHFLSLKIKDRTTPLPEVMIPVPLHKKQMRKRGYNQALELAKSLNRTLNMSINI